MPTFSKRTGWRLTPNRFTAAQNILRAQGRKLLDLTLSNPTDARLPYEGDATLAALHHAEALRYEPQPRGLLSARRAVAEYYAAHQCADCNPDTIILTASTSEGYSYIFSLLCNPGDEILVPKPSYPLFEFLADLE